MTFQEFQQSLQETTPPPEISLLLKALWYEAKDDWDMAHNIAQDIHSLEGSWIHAYLHRAEGDQSNASYWYHRANKKMPNCTLKEEWVSIVKELL